MPDLSTGIARLSARCVQGTAVRRRAVAADVSELSTRVALHRLRLTVARKVIRPTALVTRRRAAPPSSRKPAAEPASEAAARRTRCAASHAWGRAVARKMAAETAGVAATACAGAAEAESRAVGLHVAEALAVVALFGLGGAGMRASVGLVTGLLAVVAEALGRRADLGVVADVAALEARAPR